MTPKYKYEQTNDWDTALRYVDKYGYEIFQIVPHLDWNPTFTGNSRIYCTKDTYYLRKELPNNATEL